MNAACPAISTPWSQVNDRRNCSDSPPIRVDRINATRSAVRSHPGTWQAAGRDRAGWWVGCPGVITDEAERLRSYVAGLPRVRAAAGVLFFDTADRVLLVKPVYKPDWEIPGGMVEKDESPRDACLREVTEELGIELPIGPLLAVDWVPAVGVWDAGLMFVFDGGVLPVDPADVHLAAGELERFAFVSTEDLGTYLVPRMTRRVRSCIGVRSRGGVYLEDGSTVPGDASPTG